MLYNVGLISAIYHHELAIWIHMSAPSWVSLLPPAQSHCSRLLQSPSLSSLSHTANSRGRSIYICQCISFHAAVSIHLDMQEWTVIAAPRPLVLLAGYRRYAVPGHLHAEAHITDPSLWIILFHLYYIFKKLCMHTSFIIDALNLS